MQKQKIILKNVKENYSLLNRFFLIIPILYLLLPVLIYAYPKGWEKEILIKKNASNPNIFNNNNTIGITYIEKQSNRTSLYIKTSRDNGITWTRSHRIKKNIIQNSDYISIIADDNIIYCCWSDEKGHLNLLKYSVKTNKLISSKKIEDIKPFACLPKLAFDEEKNLHLFFHQEKKEKFILFHILSFDKGDSWSKQHKIAENIDIQIRGQFFPGLLFWGDYIFLVWQNRIHKKEKKSIDDELFFCHSNNLGQDWSSPIQITENIYDDLRPVLIINPQKPTLYLLWEADKDKDWDIYLKQAEIINEDTIEWQDNTHLITETLADSHQILPFFKENNLHLFWYDFRKGKSQLFHKVYNNQLQIILDSAQLSKTKYHSRNSSISLFSNIFYLSWEERNKKKQNIYFKKEDTTVPTPVIISSTHSSNQWSKKANVKIKTKPIKDDSGIKGFSYILDNQPYTIPDILNYNNSKMDLTLYDVPDGINFLHLRAIDNKNNWSDPVHYKIKIDTLGPDITDIIFQPARNNRGLYNVSFSCKYYDSNPIRGFIYQLSENLQHRSLPNRIMTSSNSGTIRNKKEGIWFLHIKGKDKLGNTSRVKSFKVILTSDDAPPTPPVIKSSSYLAGTTSTNRNGDFSYTAVDNIGIKGYNYMITKNANEQLPDKIRTTQTNIHIKKIKDGNWYFMVKAVDFNNNWGTQAEYPFTIDHTPPVIDKIKCNLITNILTNDNQGTTNYTAEINWKLKTEEDNVGYSFTLSKNRKERVLQRMQTMLPTIKYPDLKKDDYYFRIKARDKWGNWSRTRTYSLGLQTRKKIKHKGYIIKAKLFVYDDILYYKVRKGDTLAKIINIVLLTRTPQQYLSSVMKFNKIQNPDLIKKGDYIKFPLLKIKDTIVIEKIRPSFREFIKDKIIRVRRSRKGVSLKREKNLLKLKKNNRILIKVGIFLETGKFYFY